MNYPVTYERRFFALLAAIDSMPRCTTRQQAHDLLLHSWIQICSKYGLTKSQAERMALRTICPEHGWKDIDQTPCYWDSKTSPGVRIYLHDDGTIVMQRINDGLHQEILFVK